MGVKRSGFLISSSMDKMHICLFISFSIDSIDCLNTFLSATFQICCHLLPCQAPVSRFGDTAANDGALAALEHTQLPTAAKTLDIRVIEGAKKTVHDIHEIHQSKVGYFDHILYFVAFGCWMFTLFVVMMFDC